MKTKIKKPKKPQTKKQKQPKQKTHPETSTRVEKKISESKCIKSPLKIFKNKTVILMELLNFIYIMI